VSGPNRAPHAGGGSVGFEVCDGVDLDEWQAVCDACPYATFFHTPVWFSSFARCDPSMRIATKVFRFEDGKTAIFPLLERRQLGGLYVTAESSPASCYGGWVSADALTPDHALTIARSVLDSSRNLVWRVNPLDPLSEALDRFATVPDTTEILELAECAEEEAIRARFRHSARKQINKGSRAGLSVWVAEKWEEWEEYYRIYEARLRQWGKDATSSYPITFFKTLFEARGSKLSLLVVAHEGKIAGGNLNFFQSRHCVEWHAAFKSELFSIGVRDFLVDWIIRDAWRRGFAWYDFNPSGGHEGTRRFKQTFGTAPKPSNLILVRRGFYRLEPARRVLRVVRRASHA
jgi:CelD/BcsL family acetyltransferase involved in cellulose biosynthesis